MPDITYIYCDEDPPILRAISEQTRRSLMEGQWRWIEDELTPVTQEYIYQYTGIYSSPQANYGEEDDA